VAERVAADDGSSVLALPRPYSDAHEDLQDALHRGAAAAAAATDKTCRIRIIVVEIVAKDN
jgi:hypothetical protein